jgi:A/G-specific adenine glycosylase
MIRDQDFSEKILAWFAKHGRHDLPWQIQPTLYSVWVSEIMLQQTQVKTVIPYYQRFMARFPEIVDLAHAPIDEVLHLWTGLGYYARARNLHRTAQIVRDDCHGEMPDDLNQLIALPGIGRSTACAMLSLALDQAHSILDGNVKRVLARYFAVAGWPGNKQIEQILWRHADNLMPSQHARDHTQAMMDMGATLCTLSRPLCHSCPVKQGCLAYARNEQALYPHKKPKKTLPVKHTVMLIPMWQQQVLLYQRPPQGIWGGLWGFYEVESEDMIADKLIELAITSDYCLQSLSPLVHTFSHFKLQITPVVIRLTQSPAWSVTEPNSAKAQRWYNIDEPDKLGLAAPTTKLIRAIQPLNKQEKDYGKNNLL